MQVFFKIFSAPFTYEMSHKLQFLVYTSPQVGRNGVYSGKGARGVMLQGEDVYEGQSTLLPYPVDRL
jgi:hypothetical protein